jgi:hypothetical protein
LAGSIAVVKQNILVAVVFGTGNVHLMVARKQKERKNKGQDAKIPF